MDSGLLFSTVIAGTVIWIGLPFPLPSIPSNLPPLSPGAIEIYWLKCLDEFFFPSSVELVQLIEMEAESKGIDWQV